jgi:hypothetical protein
MSYDNTNKGTIAKNPRKEADTHPDIKGSINVEGRDYWLDGWQKTNSKDGSKFYSLTVKPKEARSSAPQNHRQDRSTSYDRDDPRTRRRDEDEDLPF